MNIFNDIVAPTKMGQPGPYGGFVPGRLAGYTHNGAAYCPDCAEEQTVTSADGEEEIPMEEYPPDMADPYGFGVGVISGFEEADAPGMSCTVCHRRLQTTIIHEDNQ